jgi:DNA-binding NarL/FixJ family response regulator
MIGLLVADDHEIVRNGLVQLLASQPGVAVAAEAATAADTLARVSDPAIDLVLLDLNMPGASGVPLIEVLRRARPGLPIVVLSMHSDGQIVSRALRAGAAGFVAKGSSFAVLTEAITRVANGGRYIDPALVECVVFDQASMPMALHETLSARETQVLSMIVAGMRLGEIADRLHVSAKTISTHKTRLMQKLNIDNNADLVRYAVQHGFGGGGPTPRI